MSRFKIWCAFAWAWCARHCLAIGIVALALTGAGISLALSPPLRAQAKGYEGRAVAYMLGRDAFVAVPDASPTALAGQSPSVSATASPSPTPEQLASLAGRLGDLEAKVADQEKEIGTYRQQDLELRNGLKSATEQAARTNDLLERDHNDWVALVPPAISSAHGSPSVPMPTAMPKLNPSIASAEELDAALPGIGPALAKRIIDYRTKNGPFKSAEDLLNVSGIGDALLAKIRDLLVFS